MDTNHLEYATDLKKPWGYDDDNQDWHLLGGRERRRWFHEDTRRRIYKKTFMPVRLNGCFLYAFQLSSGSIQDISVGPSWKSDRSVLAKKWRLCAFSMNV